MHLIKKFKYDKGIESLLRAEKINPEDEIVLGDIAKGYKLKGEIDLAITNYEKMIKCGDERSVTFAKQQIVKLKR